MRFVLLVSLCVIPILTHAQSPAPTPPASGTGTTTSGSSPTAVQDPQAVSVLNQALTAAGGSQVVNGVSDYTATGNITYYGTNQLQGTVKVQGLIMGGNIRIDAMLPTGVRSWAVHDGTASTKTEAGTITTLAQSANVPSSDAFPYSTPLFPSSLIFPVLPLGSFLNTQGFDISRSADTQVDSHSVHDIQLRRFLSAASATVSTPGQSRELFVDTTTSQIVMMRDVLPKGVLQEIHYSSYQSINGVLMPFVITEVINNQQIWSIQLSQIGFNSGLQDSAFALQ